MGKSINILFLGGAKRLSLAERFIEAGIKNNIDVKIFSYELDEDVPLINIAKVIIGKKWNDPEIYTHLLQTIKDYEINIILPFVDRSIKICAELKTIAKNVFIPVSELNLVNIFYDKCLSNDWFEKKGMPLPVFDNTFPAIAKPRYGSASKGIVIINSKEEYNELVRNNKLKEYLIQKYIDAEEFTVDCYLSKTKKIIGIVPRKRLVVIDGEVNKSIIVLEKKIIKYCEELLNNELFEGPITIQFLKCKQTNNFFIMEINPRFGGGVINSIEAGFDIPHIIINECLNKPVKRIIDFKNNLLMLRANREVFICK